MATTSIFPPLCGDVPSWYKSRHYGGTSTTSLSTTFSLLQSTEQELEPMPQLPSFVTAVNDVKPPSSTLRSIGEAASDSLGVSSGTTTVRTSFRFLCRQSVNIPAQASSTFPLRPLKSTKYSAIILEEHYCLRTLRKRVDDVVDDVMCYNLPTHSLPLRALNNHPTSTA